MIGIADEDIGNNASRTSDESASVLPLNFLKPISRYSLPPTLAPLFPSDPFKSNQYFLYS